MKKQFVIFIAFLLTVCRCLSASDNQFWEQIHILHWKKDKFKLFTYYEFRFFHHEDRFRFFLFRPELRYRALPWLDLELHYSIIERRSSPLEPLVARYRLEIEVNPYFKLNKRVTLLFRNRYELNKDQGTNKLKSILRSRTRLYFNSESKNRRFFKGWSISNEVFYNLTTRQFFENRFTLIELNLKISKNYTLRPLLLFKSNKNDNNHWFTDTVLAFKLDYLF